MRNSFQIGRIFGISIRIDYTWFVIFALIVWTLGSHYFPQLYPNWSMYIYWLMGIITAIIFFSSVIAHELAHSLVSKARGVPVRSITLFIFGGVAEISDEPKKPGSEFWMAIAGPLTSFGIAFIFILLYFASGRGKTPFSAMSLWLSYINLSIAIFNLIPGFPLDGGRVLRSIIWKITGSLKSATRSASIVGRIVAYLFILWGIWRIFFNNDVFGGIWIAFIGWFLENAASSSYRQMALRDTLQGVKVRDIMISDCAILLGQLTVRGLVDNYILHSNHQCFPISDGNNIIGVITLKMIKEIPQDQWETTTMKEAMIPLDEIIAVHPDEEVFTVMQKMTVEQIYQFPVMENGQLIGLVSRDNIMNVINLKTELRI
ncbi:MAG: site-2 protease family protein [Candidatus Poribacteria bacterium]